MSRRQGQLEARQPRQATQRVAAHEQAFGEDKRRVSASTMISECPQAVKQSIDAPSRLLMYDGMKATSFSGEQSESTSTTSAERMMIRLGQRMSR